MQDGSVGHNFERDPPKDHPCQVWFNLVQGFQRKRFKSESLRRTTDADGCQVMTKAHMSFGQVSLKGCTRLATTSDKAYQLLAHGRWFSPGTPASFTTKTGRHDIAEILLKVVLSTKNQSNPIIWGYYNTDIWINRQTDEQK